MADLRLLLRPQRRVLGRAQGVRAGARAVELCRQYGEGGQCHAARLRRGARHGDGLRHGGARSEALFVRGDPHGASEQRRGGAAASSAG